MIADTVIDCCGYVLPYAELLYEHSEAGLRGRWAWLEQWMELTPVTPGIGDWTSPYLRFVTEPGSDTPWLPREPSGRRDVPPRVLHDDPGTRLALLDAVDIDVQLLHPGPALDAVCKRDTEIAAALLGAYNRYVADYCAADPARLKSVVQVFAAEPQWSAREIGDMAADPSVAAVTIHLPVDVSPDHRNFHGIWDALEATGLPLIHRPGSSAALWTASRFGSYLDGTGIFDGWPGVRLAALGSVPNPPRWPHGRLFAAIESADVPGHLETADLLWASHFPFDDPSRTAELIGAARGGSTPARAALIDNPARFFGNALLAAGTRAE